MHAHAVRHVRTNADSGPVDDGWHEHDAGHPRVSHPGHVDAWEHDPGYPIDDARLWNPRLRDAGLGNARLWDPDPRLYPAHDSAAPG